MKTCFLCRKMIGMSIIALLVLNYGCEPNVEEQTKAVIKALQVSMNVNTKSGTNDAAKADTTKDYEISVDVNISGDTKSMTLYVHLFQREVGGNEYNYQSSTAVFINSPTTLKVWAGGQKDIRKQYEIYAVINTTAEYKKTDNVYSVATLPETMKQRLTIYIDVLNQLYQL